MQKAHDHIYGLQIVSLRLNDLPRVRRAMPAVFLAAANSSWKPWRENILLMSSMPRSA